MPAASQLADTLTVVPSLPASRTFRCANRLVSAKTSRSRVDHEVAEEGTRRLGTMAILTAVTGLGLTTAPRLLQPELSAAHQTPLFRLSALFLVLASAGLALLQRYGSLSAQTLLDIGLAFEIAGAFVLGVMENVLPWANHPVRGATGVAAWLA